MDKIAAQVKRQKPSASSTSAPTITDDDFSYITDADLDQAHSFSTRANQTDVLCLWYQGNSHDLRFPPNTIKKPSCTIGNVRAVIDSLYLDANDIKLIYMGQELTDDSKSCRDYNITNQSEILGIDGDEYLERPYYLHDFITAARRILSGGNGKEMQQSPSQKGSKPWEPITTGDHWTCHECGLGEISKFSDRCLDCGHLMCRSCAWDSGRAFSEIGFMWSQIPASSTSMEQLVAISRQLHSRIIPLCIKFIGQPPREEQHRLSYGKELVELVISKILLKLDAVEVVGDDEARSRRSLVKVASRVVSDLNAACTGGQISPQTTQTPFNDQYKSSQSLSNQSSSSVRGKEIENQRLVNEVKKRTAISNDSEEFADGMSNLEISEPQYYWDIESVSSDDAEIFSTSGSVSTNTTISSMRLTAIECIVGRFLDDLELRSMFEDAMRRMDRERFVRNQRRLLKQFYINLRPLAWTPLQQQAVKILRGRAERTSIADRIFTAVSPSSPSKSADLAALKSLSPDKRSQLERLLEPMTGQTFYDWEDERSSQGYEDSDDSDSDQSNFADIKYPNAGLATEFVVEGDPYKKYKDSLRNFLHLDAGVWGPVTLHDYVVKGDTQAVTKLLTEHFDDVAQLEFDWLHELLDIGCMYEEMARLLIDGENASPWISFDQPVTVDAAMKVDFHQPNCVHSGGQKLDMAPRLIRTISLQIQDRPEISTVNETISRLCGIGGALPPADNSEDLDSAKYGQATQVKFSLDNGVAYVRLGSFDPNPAISRQAAHVISELRRAITAIGFLQHCGLCCDAFTILRIKGTANGPPYIELRTINVKLLERLRANLESWIANPNVALLDSCALSANIILAEFCEEYSNLVHTNRPAESFDLCVRAVQCISMGILCYTQGHTGPIHPSYLVNALNEIHLSGYSSGENHSLVPYIQVKLFNFTCMKGAIRDSVLVFSMPSWQYDVSNMVREFDLFASPEDLADTWSPARFVTDKSAPDKSSMLYAVEMGGGTITLANERENKLHWSPGSISYDDFRGTFSPKKKYMIGGTVVNLKCPLDETKSFQHPGTNGYIRHLGTHQNSWQVKERQAGIQGGQYAVLAFNQTYVKQPGVTLKQQQLMLPSNEIDLAFLNSTCGLQVSFCTGVARRVALRQ